MQQFLMAVNNLVTETGNATVGLDDANIDFLYNVGGKVRELGCGYRCSRVAAAVVKPGPAKCPSRTSLLSLCVVLGRGLVRWG